MSRIEGRPLLRYFGYTHCPDVCPTTMADVAAALHQLPKGTTRPDGVFVSTDPQRDTPACLKEWLDAIDPAFVGLTEKFATIARAARSLGIAVSAPVTNSDGSVTVDHGAEALALDAGDARDARPVDVRPDVDAHRPTDPRQADGLASATAARPAAGLPARPAALLHSRFAAVVSSPFFTLPPFIASLYSLYFTSLFDWAMSSWPGHEWMLAHFLATGLLFFWPIMGIDPAPRRPGHQVGGVEARGAAVFGRPRIPGLQGPDRRGCLWK